MGTMKFAVLAVVMAVVSSPALGYQGNQGYNQGYDQYNQVVQYDQGYDQEYNQGNLMSLMGNMMNRNSQGQNFDIYSNLVENVNPAILTESQELLLKTIRRTEELINNMPSTAETARQMTELWRIAYPQLRTLLTKAGAWANYSPVPSGAGVY